MDAGRRGLLGATLGILAKVGALAAGLGAGHILIGGTRRPAGPAARKAAETAGLVRPPGALEEPAFLAACIRCNLCQDACEPGAVQYFTEAHGRHYQTPYVDPALKGCTLCMKCTQVCPSGALTPMEFKDRAEAEMGSVALREDLCLSFKAQRVRNEQAMMWELGKDPTETESPLERRGPCGECYMFCPLRERAIKLEPGAFLAPLVFEEECVGCGMCEEICRVILRGEPAIRVVPTRHMG